MGYALVTGLRIGSLSEIIFGNDRSGLIWTRAHKARCALFTFLDYGVFNHKASCILRDIFDIIVGKLHAVLRSSIIDIDTERRAGEFNIHCLLQSEKIVSANSFVLRSKFLPISDLSSRMGNLYINGIDRHQIDILVSLGWTLHQNLYSCSEEIAERLLGECIQANMQPVDKETASQIAGFAISMWSDTNWKCNNCKLDWYSLVLDCLRSCVFVKGGHVIFEDLRQNGIMRSHIPKMLNVIALNCDCMHSWAHIYSNLQFYAGKLEYIGLGKYNKTFEAEFISVVTKLNNACTNKM